MARKKKEEYRQDAVELNSVHGDGNIVMNDQKSESVFLRETLFALDEIKEYGLNQYFLRAILKNKYYTLSDAHRLIRESL